jgi:glycosyltransferase involved in cell wall biosynthesis
MNKAISILGTRGLPAAHGGFETFAEHLALFLVDRGWRVTVYCQEEGQGPVIEDMWEGIRRVRMPVKQGGAVGTVVFDWRSTRHAAKEDSLVLTLGYNTASFGVFLRLGGLLNIINMDGIEWRRQKWGAVARTWFWLNDWAGCWVGNHLVADHPEIARHLSTRVSSRKITMIPYGADRVVAADEAPVRSLGLKPGGYAVLIARAEPENSVLEVVSAWSRQHRGHRLVVLGKYADDHDYQRRVKQAASQEVMFVGAIYDKAVVHALRFHASFYVHGHQVGGTNPSLVEALGAGNAVLAHDNPYNRWVAGTAGVYFRGLDQCEQTVAALIANARGLAHKQPEWGSAPAQTVDLAALRSAAVLRHAEAFTWPRVLEAYERLFVQVALPD